MISILYLFLALVLKIHLRESNVAAHSGMSSHAAASSSVVNAPENMVVAQSIMTSFAVDCVDAMNAPRNMVVAHAS